jgi:hypothetical protein
MDDRIEQRIRDGWKQVSEDTRGEYRGPNAGLPPVPSPGPEPVYAPPSRAERVGSEPLSPSSDSNLTPSERRAVFAMLRAAMAQLQMDGSVGTISEVSPELESAMMKLRS